MIPSPILGKGPAVLWTVESQDASGEGLLIPSRLWQGQHAGLGLPGGASAVVSCLGAAVTVAPQQQQGLCSGGVLFNGFLKQSLKQNLRTRDLFLGCLSRKIPKGREGSRLGKRVGESKDVASHQVQPWPVPQGRALQPDRDLRVVLQVGQPRVLVSPCLRAVRRGSYGLWTGACHQCGHAWEGTVRMGMGAFGSYLTASGEVAPWCPPPPHFRPLWPHPSSYKGGQ